MEEIHIQIAKPPLQHHDKKTVNVKVHQNTKIDARRHVTDTY